MNTALVLRRIVAAVLTIPVVMFMIAILIINGPRLIGYRVNETWFDVAEIAIEKKDVDVCRSILNIGLFVPTTWESRVDCVKKYASTLKDPSACERLAPHVIMNCAAGAIDDGPCIFSGEKIAWQENGIQKNTSLEACSESRIKTPTLASCCIIWNAYAKPEFNECSSISSGEPFLDQCALNIALRHQDPMRCNDIKNIRTKEGCRLMAQPTNINP